MKVDKGALAPAAVLDSQVVFDWLVFRRASVQPVADAVTTGRLRWLASPALRDELGHVLGRGVLARYAPDEAAVWSAWDRFAQPCAQVPASGAALRLRCRDPDDQKFIDLALAHGARWLLSRDKAVLALARRARPFGLQILTPEAWALAAATDTDTGTTLTAGGLLD